MEHYFKGFEPLSHITLIGATNAGKTTWVITTLMKDNGFSDFDIFVYVASDLAKDIDEMREAVIIHTGKQEDNFVFFKNTDINNCLNFLKHHEKNKHKLVFFDDIQPAGNKAVQIVSQFIKEAKNAQCTIINSLHSPSQQNGEIDIRNSSGYFVLFNQTPENFAKYVKLNSKQNIDNLYQKYMSIEGGKHNRVVIVDIHNFKLYYGTGDFKEFDPLINNKKENDEE